MSKRDDGSKIREASIDDQLESGERQEGSHGEDEAGEADLRMTRQNTYRNDDWVEGQTRIIPQAEAAVQPRRSLKGASSGEIAQAHAEMLADLICEAHDFAMDYFEAARGIDDRVSARSRKLSMAVKLSTVAIQLVAAADRHHKEWPSL